MEGSLHLPRHFLPTAFAQSRLELKPDLKPVVASELRTEIEVMPTDFVVVEMYSRMLIKLQTVVFCCVVARESR